MVNRVSLKQRFVSALVYAYGNRCPLFAPIAAAAKDDKIQQK